MTKRAEGVAQVVEHLPSKHATLSSNPVHKNKTKEKQNPNLLTLAFSELSQMFV
jgi:hypothetical protein